MNLYVPFYQDKHPERDRELQTCLRKNLESGLFERVILLLDTPVSNYPRTPDDGFIPINLGRRPTYQDFFNLFPKYGDRKTYNVIANSDIYFDSSVLLIECLDLEARRSALALSRWNVMDHGASEHYNHEDSQDVWIFQGFVSNVLADFNLGHAGCDNRIAYELIRGLFRTYNPSLGIRSHHLHLTNIRNYSSHEHSPDRIPGPYAFLVPSKIEHLPLDLVKSQPEVLSTKIVEHNIMNGNGKRIFHLALNNPESPQPALETALRSLGSEYYQYDWWAVQHDPLKIRDELDRVRREYKPDLSFLQVQTPGILDAFSCAGLPGVSINWTGDARQPTPQWYFDIAPHVTTTCFSNETDVGKLRSQGLRADYLQIGFNNNVFKPDGTRGGYPPIVFLGGNYGDAFPLSGYRREMVARLQSEFGPDFEVYGPGWESKRVLNQWEEAECYRSAKLAINLSHLDLERYSSDRLFRALGCGGALILTHNYPGLEREFTPGDQLMVWNDIDDLVRLCRFFLTGGSAVEIQRQRMAAQGMNHAHMHCTWDARMSDLKRIVGW